jgi:ABC-type transport system involved in cytochrome c biogenesis permease subunit
MSKTSLFKNLAFGLAGLTTIMLVVATAVEKVCGSTTAFAYIYQSPWMIALWAATAACSVIYLAMRRRALSLPTLGLHAALLLILIGAAVTHFTGLQGKLMLTIGEQAVSRFTLDDGEPAELPFCIALDRTIIEYYPGTSAAMNYASEVTVTPLPSAQQSASAQPSTENSHHRLSMNNILQIQGYRFYQTALGQDYSVLSVSSDPWGIGITYGGYALLILSMVSFLFSSKSRFRGLLHRAMLPLLLLVAGLSASAAEAQPKTVPHALATRLGKVNVYWGDRVMPLQTMARDFCLKVYGSETYMGLSAEQVVAGWLFYYDDWKHRPFIKTGGGEVGKLIGNRNKYAALTDFYYAKGYKLENAVASDLADRKLREVDERVAMVTMVCTGAAFKVFPLTGGNGTNGSNATNGEISEVGKVEWYSFADRPPVSVDDETYIFMSTCLDNITREVFHRQWKNAADELLRLREFQEASAPAGTLPSERMNNVERFYNRFSSPLLPAVLCLLVGIALICLPGKMKIPAEIAGWLLLLWVTALLALRWIIGKHLPLSNGYETMLMLGWLSLVATAVANRLRRQLPMVAAAGLIVAGLALMVAMMGRSGATVSHLMPVLASPLLSIHVLLVMASYALLAIIAILSATSLCQRRKANGNSERLTATAAMLLYPAVFLLAAGIFVGAVWANQSWGRYWGWDPKETWALITLLIYALPLHAVSFPSFNFAEKAVTANDAQKPARHSGKFFNIYLLLAFLSVLMTYFGVNYLLSGMHSYA